MVNRIVAQRIPVTAPITDCTITVIWNRAFLTGTYPLELVRETASYLVDGHRFAPAYNQWIWDPFLKAKRRAWDGRSHLFDLKTRSMPAGLIHLVTDALREENKSARIRIINTRDENAPACANDPNGFTLKGIKFGQGKFDYQLEAAKAAIKAKQGILKMATNSGKTEVSCAITAYLKIHTLFVVPGIDLLYQTRERFAKRLGFPISKIGIIGDQEFQIGDWITVATIDSLYAKKDEPVLFEAMQHRWQLIFIDECHKFSSETGFSVLDNINSYYRFGLSGTPLDRTDGADLRLIAQTGNVVYEISNKLLIERNISVPVDIELKRIDQPKSRGRNWKSVQREAIIQNEFLNGDICRWVPIQLAHKYQVVILVKEIAHGEVLERRLRAASYGFNVKFLHGSETTDNRRQALKDFSAGTLHCIIGTSILYQGIDTPNIDILVFADLGKSRIAVLQALGRGLRSRPGKKRLLVRDYANFCHRWLTEHSLARLKTYKGENCFRIHIAS